MAIHAIPLMHPNARSAAESVVHGLIRGGAMAIVNLVQVYRALSIFPCLYTHTVIADDVR
jgi:hypothetical protein